MAACQPTPEKKIVVGKNDFEEKIQQTEAPAEPYKAPQSWKESVSTENGFLSIVIDADVSVPDVTNFPVTVIEPMQISQEQADKAIKALFNDNVLYELNTAIKTKDEIQEEILKIKAHLADKDSDLYYIKDSDPEYYEQAVNELNAKIQSLEQQIEGAPEEYTPKPASLIFEDGKKTLFPGMKEEDLAKMPDMSLIQGEAYLGRKKPASIVIVSDTGKLNNKIFFQNYDESVFPNFDLYEKPKQSDDLAVSADEAVKTAENILSSMGLSKMKLAAVGYDREIDRSTHEAKEYPVLLFTQSINGIPVNYVRSSSYSQSPMYSAPWYDESLLIGVDENGINRFEWMAPIKIAENVTDNASLMPFDDIKAAFKEQTKVRDIWNDGNPYVIGKEIHITKIVLGLVKVPKENDPDKGLLVPAWDFYGYSVDKYSQQEPGGYELNDNNEYVDNKFMNSYITINAIDGSVIERTISAR